MRKFIIIITMSLMGVASSYAQSYVSGSIGTSYEIEAENLKFSIGLEYGKFISEKSGIGCELNYKYEKDKRNVIALQPYYRHYFVTGRVGFFLDATIGCTYTKPEVGEDAWGIKAGFVPGVDFQLSDKFSFIAKLGFLGYYQPDETKKYVRFDADASNLKFGCVYKF